MENLTNYTLNISLKKIFKESGLSQTDFAKKIGVHKQTVYKILNNKEVLGWIRFKNILKKLDCEIDETDFINIF